MWPATDVAVSVFLVSLCLPVLTMWLAPNCRRVICREELDLSSAEWEGLSEEAKSFVKALLAKDYVQVSLSILSFFLLVS
jgi:hypothetical protein